MAVYRKQPTVFNVPSKPIRQSKSFVPFSGLEINDNPLLNTNSSAADMLNMIVDDNYFLTMRPRLEHDKVYDQAILDVEPTLVDAMGEDYVFLDAIKIKDRYIIAAGMLDEGAIIDVAWYGVGLYSDANPDGVWLEMVYGTSDFPFAVTIDEVKKFDNFVVSIESGVIRFTSKLSFAGFTLPLDAPHFPDFTVPYVPIYKANILSKDTLNEAPIYEDLNILSDQYRLTFQYSEGQEDTYQALESTSTNVDGTIYELDKILDLDSASVERLVISITALNDLSPRIYKRAPQFDTYYLGIGYYGWTLLGESGVSIYSLLPYITPESALFNNVFNVISNNVAYNPLEKVEVISAPSINNDDIVYVGNDSVIYVDGGAAEAVIHTSPTNIKVASAVYIREPVKDHYVYGKRYYAWIRVGYPATFYYTDSVSDVTIGTALYVDSGTSMVATYTITGVTYPRDMSVPFYKVDITSKFQYELFRLHVGVNGPNGEFISPANFKKLYLPKVTYDGNSNRVGKFVYDPLHDVILRATTEKGELPFRTAKDGGRVAFTDFFEVSTPSRFITLSIYKVGGTAVKQKKLKIDTSTVFTNDEAFNKWRFYYFSGRFVAVWDGTFLGINNLGLAVAKTNTNYDDLDFNKFNLIIAGGAMAYSGNESTIIPAPTRPNYGTAQYFEIISHILWDGTNTHLLSPYDLQELLNIGGTGPLTPDTDSIDSVALILHVNGVVSNKVYLYRLSGKKIAIERMNGSVVGGGQAVLYSVDNANGQILPDIIIIPFVAMAATRGYSLPISYKGLVHPIINLNIDVSGDVTAIMRRGSKINIGRYKFDFDYNGAVSNYFSSPISTIGTYDTYPFEGRFILVQEDGDLLTISDSSSPITFTYDINNAANPLKLTKESSDAYNEARAALINADKPILGQTHVAENRIYYKANYIFVTEADNYDYLPVMYSHKTPREVRHASSYLQSIGTIFEQNMIEFVSFVDNPFISTTFINHARLPLFEKYEQPAIDYLDTKHLVTFFGQTIYLSKGGLFSLTFEAETTQDNIRKATLVSKVVNARLTKENISTAILVNSDPYVLIMFPDAVKRLTRVYAYRADYAHWYYWELPIVVLNTQDDNLYLRLQYEEEGVRKLAYFTDLPIQIVIDPSLSSYQGSVERYLDFDTTYIPWFWKSQIMSMGSITKQKQVIETYFTFVNNNAGITIDTDKSFDVTSHHVTSQEFGIRYFSYNDIVTVAPKVEFEDRLNVINNINRRTYLSRFNYCQLLCYNIDKDNRVQDKVRLANIVIIYKYLSGGK